MSTPEKSSHPFLYAVNVDDDYRRNDIFSRIKVDIRVFKEKELVFEGHMIFLPHGWQFPTIITFFDKIPFITEDGAAIKRYIDAY